MRQACSLPLSLSRARVRAHAHPHTPIQTHTQECMHAWCFRGHKRFLKSNAKAYSTLASTDRYSAWSTMTGNDRVSVVFLSPTRTRAEYGWESLSLGYLDTWLGCDRTSL